LLLDANGDRYFIARRWATNELSFVHAPRGGGYGWSALGEQCAASTEPWDEWVLAGRLPPGARRVAVAWAGGPCRTKARPGLWMAAVPYGEVQGELRFLDAAGRAVENRELWLPAPGRGRPKSQGAVR
jgi:hypothetical protein